MTTEISDFETQVLEESKSIPVLVDFWADWCGPCKVLGPVLEKLAESNRGQWKLAKVDTEKFREVAAQYSITSIPNVKLFVDGQVTDEFVGALPEPKVVEWLGKALPSPYRARLDDAKQLLGEKKLMDARRLAEEVLQAEGGNDLAALLVAETYLASDPGHAAELLQTVAHGSEYFEQAEAVRALASLLIRSRDSNLFPQEPTKESYIAAIESLEAMEFEAALEGFIGIVRKDRSYDGEGARKACIAIFNLLGATHPITKRYQRLLSNALY